MSTSIRSLSAVTFSVGLALSATPALASEYAMEAYTGEEAIGAEVLVASAELEQSGIAVPEITSEDRSDAELITSIDRALAPIDESSASNLGEESGLSFSANVALTSEYRFRGVALSDGEIAIQGGFDLSHSSGIYVGTWASSLDETTVGFGSTEVDLYGGWSGDLSDAISADVGVILYAYPDAGPGDFDYWEFYGSISFSIGPASITPGIAYAPDQDSLGSTDNLYLYTDLSVGIPDTPITINGHLGYTDGFLTFTGDSEAIDWSIGADIAAGPVTFSLAYMDVEGDTLLDPGKVFTDDALVGTISASF